MMTREEQKQETRAKILAAAIHLIAKNGVNGTSIRDITSRAGVAAGTFYLYFDSKEDVIRCLDRREHKELLAKVKAMEGLTCVQRIYKYFSEWYKIGGKLEPGFIREWHRLMMSNARDNEANEMPGGEMEASHIHELLSDALEAGELDENIPLDDIARMWICGLWGSSIYLCVAPNRVSRDKVARDFLEHIIKPSLNPYLTQ
ncbi:MAG: TetR/AcrR family transcriptional regulator [Synergistaceae bacterium]|nr:TetR/AcrR family transcriptional regulator [Synergistaceae bacterium]